MYFHPLNFIRFLLAIGVVLFHYGQYYFPFDHSPLYHLIIHSSFRVSFFFFISGFVMSMVYAKQSDNFSALDFYKRRLSRIFPLYALAFVWTLLVVVFLNHASPKGLNILLHAVGLQSLLPGHVLDLNFTTWSISVELVFYAVFPFLLKWILAMPLKRLLYLTSVIWLAQTAQHVLFIKFVYNGTKAMEEFISTFPLWHLSTFFVGMVSARLIALNAFGNFLKNKTILFIVVSLLIFMYIIYFQNPFLKYVHNGLLSPVFFLLIISLYYDRSFIHKFLSNKKVSKLGDLSYVLFIFQYPLWVTCTYIVSPEFVKSSRFFFIYFLILLLVATLLNKYVEKPLMKYLRKEKE